MSEQIENPFCIIMSASHKALLERQRMIEDDPVLGRQRKCSMCGEWWPMDTAFFMFTMNSKGPRMESWCRDCSNIYKTRYKARSVEAEKVNSPPVQ